MVDFMEKIRLLLGRSSRLVAFLATTFASYAVLCGLLGHAAAQSIGTAIIEFGDRENNELTDLQAFPITGTECSEQTSITFEVGTVAQPVPTSRNELQFWRGNDCNEEARRVDSNEVTPCDDITGAISSGNDLTIRGTPIEIITPISNLVDCGEGGSTDNNIFILAVNQDGESTEGFGRQLRAADYLFEPRSTQCAYGSRA